MTETTEPTKFTRLRTTIVVVSMVLMPLFAVIGVKMPKFLSDKANESAGVTSADSKAKPTPRATGTRPAKAAPLAGAVSLAQAESGHDHSAAEHSHSSAPPVFTSPTTADPMNSDVRAGASGVAQAVALESMTGSPMSAATVAGHAAPVGFETTGSIQPLPPLEETNRTTGSTPSGGAASSDQFSQIQTRLKALGATHYTLETWGPSGDSYRFQCRMAAGHSADYTRQFEATDTDAVRTMQTVLDEVEAWKAGRLP